MGVMGHVIAGRAALAEVLDMACDAASGGGDATRSAPATEPEAERSHAHPPLFDRFVDGLNRLPRPMLAFGTLALFAHAMIDPVRFAERMTGLRAVPEPLWWLIGAVVGFYFGAREAHHFRARPAVARPAAARPSSPEATAEGQNGALDA